MKIVIWYIIKRTLHCTNFIFLKLRSREAPTLPEIKDMSHPKGEFSRKYNKGLCWKSTSEVYSNKTNVEIQTSKSDRSHVETWKWEWRTHSTLATILTGHEFCRYHGYCPLIKQSASHIFSSHDSLPTSSVCLSLCSTFSSKRGRPHYSPDFASQDLCSSPWREPSATERTIFKTVNNYIYKLV